MDQPRVPEMLPPLPHHAEQLAWAYSYDGYARLGDGPESLGRLLGPARRHWRKNGEVPSWCGLDLLRGWAFLLQRTDHHNDGLSLDADLRREWVAVLAAVAAHPACPPDERPPGASRP